MKALSLIGLVFGTFLITLGALSVRTAGSLSYAVIIGGASVVIFVAIFWLITFTKEKKGKDSPDS